ncbi:MAG: hypothetical protein NTX64_09185 [Elusimicrobia bacterium]|nr:hypothetical protein [Elusimicrobiota bacterium]
MNRWVAAAAGGAFLLVTEQIQATHLGFELDKTQRSVREARDHEAHLRFQLDQETTPGELAVLARSRLGMIPPNPDAVVLLDQANDRPVQAPPPLFATAGPAEELSPAGAPRVGTAEPHIAIAEPRVGAAERFDRVRSAGASILRTQLLSWLLPPDSPRWR